MHRELLDFKRFLLTYRYPLLAVLLLAGAWWLEGAIRRHLGANAAFSFVAYLVLAIGAAYGLGFSNGRRLRLRRWRRRGTSKRAPAEAAPAKKAAQAAAVAVQPASQPNAIVEAQANRIAELERELACEREVVAALTETFSPEHME